MWKKKNCPQAAYTAETQTHAYTLYTHIMHVKTHKWHTHTHPHTHTHTHTQVASGVIWESRKHVIKAAFGQSGFSLMWAPSGCGCVLWGSFSCVLYSESDLMFLHTRSCSVTLRTGSLNLLLLMTEFWTTITECFECEVNDLQHNWTPVRGFGATHFQVRLAAAGHQAGCSMRLLRKQYHCPLHSLFLLCSSTPSPV